MSKNWKKWESAAAQLHDNLVAMPDIVAHVEIAQRQIGRYNFKLWHAYLDGLSFQYHEGEEHKRITVS